MSPHRPQVSPKVLSNPDYWMAIVGDSGVTGAASSSGIEPNALNLLSHVIKFGWDSRLTAQLPSLSDYPNPQRFGIFTVEPMTRVLYSSAEFDKAKRENKVADLNLQSKGSLALDVQEHGNGYMIGRALNMKAQDIVLVGQDGVRVSAIPEQFARIFEMQTETLPPLILVSFTANDFCDMGALTDNLAERRARFEKSLAQAWEKAVPYLKPHPQGTRILVLPALEVANVLTNRRLLRQQVYFQGQGLITCQQVRDNINMDGFLSAKMAESLGGMCKAVLTTRPSDEERIQRLRDIQNEFNQVWKTQVASLNQRFEGKGLVWTYLEGMRAIEFDTGDLANDCFHPGAGAHSKLADYILRTVFKR